MPPSLYGVEEEVRAIWVYLEQEGGTLADVSLEMLSKGRQLADRAGWHLAALILGYQVSDLVDQAFSYKADQVWRVDHPLLADFTIEAYAQAAFQAVMEAKPSIFLLGATDNGRDLAGRLAVRLRTGLNADCTDLRLEEPEGVLISEVSGFGGGVLAQIQMARHRPQMASVRPGVFPLDEALPGRQGTVVTVPLDMEKGEIRTRILERVVGEGVDLTQTPVLVAGGRGVGGNFEIMKDLAALLEGEVGGTRPAVDEGFIERERQIGQTGVVCSPKVVICCGISGAFHFIVGIEKAGTVIAINSDPEAPIFEFSDYCVVGDVNQIIPALVTKLRSIREVPHA
jgi:electron transfer flavoprotein alpha subunit